MQIGITRFLSSALPIAIIVTVALADEPSTPPDALVGKLIEDGCDARPRNVSSRFREEQGCEMLREYFKDSSQTTEALVLADRALVTRTIDHEIEGSRLSTSNDKQPFPEKLVVTRDYYFHLQKEDGDWRLVAVRSLATPWFVQSACLTGQFRQSEGAGELTIEGSDRLMCMGDAEISKWFDLRRADYEALRNRLIESRFVGHKAFDADGTDLARLAEKTGISSVSGVTPDEAGDSDYRGMCESGCLAFTVAGILDNTVGFIWSPGPDNLPPLDPSSVIMLRPLGGGWWLFKTT